MKALTAKQLQTALLLAGGTTITEAAKQTETARQTVHDWLKEDLFTAHLNSLKDEVVEAGRSQVQTSVTLAITTLCDIMKSSQNDVARFNCAKEILFMSGLSRELKIGATTAEGVRKGREEYDMFNSL